MKGKRRLRKKGEGGGGPSETVRHFLLHQFPLLTVGTLLDRLPAREQGLVVAKEVASGSLARQGEGGRETQPGVPPPGDTVCSSVGERLTRVGCGRWRTAGSEVGFGGTGFARAVFGEGIATPVFF